MAFAVPKTKISAKQRKRLRKKKIKIKAALIILIMISAVILYYPVKRKIERVLHPAPIGTVKVDWYKDLNPIHLKYARRNGVSPFKTNNDFAEKIDELQKEKKLVEISDNRYYRVCHLTYSHAFLTPVAKEFLNDLGKRFREKLDEKDKPDYYFQISSLLRTRENQKKLSRINGNASPNSSHLFGTTFDIPYFTVIKRTFLWNEAEVTDGTASKLLSEAIGELRKEGRCVVVTERKERCFHITVKK